MIDANPAQKEFYFTNIAYPVFLVVVQFLYTDFVDELEISLKAHLVKAAQDLNLKRLEDFASDNKILAPSTLVTHLHSTLLSGKYADVSQKTMYVSFDRSAFW
jgi:hypothetical protein